VCDLETSRIGAPYVYDISSLRVKFLYKKKERLNKSLYEVHLEAALDWGKSRYIILESVNKMINQELERKYRILDEKLNKLVKSHKQIINNNTKFYPRPIQQ